MTVSDHTIVFLTLLVTSSEKDIKRVLYGETDTNDRYPYVIAISTISPNVKVCTGTLIQDIWVITAAHCGKYPTQIRYGNMQVPSDHSKATFKEIIKWFKHPAFSENFNTLTNDIALVLTKKITLKSYGVLSGIDYQSIYGYPVKYIGFGYPWDPRTMDNFELIMIMSDNDSETRRIGNAVIQRCSGIEFESRSSSKICIAAKCSNRYQRTTEGDSGGPLLLRGKVIGVCCCSPNDERFFVYTPISPYLDWMETVLGNNSGKS